MVADQRDIAMADGDQALNVGLAVWMLPSQYAEDTDELQQRTWYHLARLGSRFGRTRQPTTQCLEPSCTLPGFATLRLFFSIESAV